jgi:DNA topoisomerase-1
MEISELTDMGTSETRLYALIWRRTIQSVMAPETRDVVSLKAHFTVAPTVATLKTDWDRTAFAGWRVLDHDVEKDAAEITAFEARRALLPDTTIPWTTVTANETHTSPPPSYTEASLIRDLESRGIGRPSTFATLVETVLERGYVEKNTVAAAPVTLKGLVLVAAAAKAAKPKATTRTERAGGERDKLRVTPLGRTVIEWLLAQFGDMLEYGFTAAMETQLDEVSRGVLPWDAVLTGTWDRYKTRYATIMAPAAALAAAGAGATAAVARANSRVAEYGDGYKMVISKKGPLFVLETEGAKTRFASVPAGLSLQTATRADAEAAFSPAAGAGGELLGSIDDAPVHRKKGPYGHYAEWKGKRISCKPDETFEEISSRLAAAAAAAAAPDAVDHQVGPYKIRRGPYGLYMFKITTGATKPRFVSIPAETPWSTLTPETAEQVYKLASASKAEAAKAGAGAGAKSKPKRQGPVPSK